MRHTQRIFPTRGIRAAPVALALGCALFVGRDASFAQHKEPPRGELALQFADDFDHELDPRRWAVRGACKTEDGFLRLDASRSGPPGPGPFTFSYLDLKEKCLAPGLRGTNGAEITLAAYTHETEYPQELEGNVVREHRMGWGITLASWRGQIGQNNPEDRGLQLHIDWLGHHGLFVSFVRSLVPEDFKQYPNDDVWRSTADEFHVKRDKLIEQGPFISEPCLVMDCRVFRPALKFLAQSHRFGLYLADDAKTAYWTLDGRVMDTFDTRDYFASSPQVAAGGLYLTIAGAGVYQKNVFLLDDLKIYASGPDSPGR